MFTKYCNSIFFVGFCTLFMGACQTVVRPEMPDPLLSREQMTTLLVDIAEVKAAKEYNAGLLQQKGICPTDYIYIKNGINSEIYKQNNQWYAAQPKVYQSLFWEVKKRLKAKKNVLEQRKKRMDRLQDRADSIAMAIDSICGSKKQGL